MVHQPDKRHVVLRFNQKDIFDMARDPVNRLADVRVKVYWIDNLHIVILRGDFSQRVTDLLETPAKALATVASDQNGFCRCEGTDSGQRALSEDRCLP